MCVDLKYQDLSDGAVIWQYVCNNGRAQQWFTDKHSPENYAFETSRWYQRYEDSYNYTTWMTLTFDRQVLAGGSQFDGYVTNAVNAWNGPASTNTVYLAEYQPVDWHDIHLAVLGSNTNCYFQAFGLTSCFQGGAIGEAFFFDQHKDVCNQGCFNPQDKPYTYWYSTVLISQTGFLPYSDAVRKDSFVHELGHSIGWLDDVASDGTCYSPLKRIMDYDCVFDSVYDGPQPWDSCAINHEYYDPNWGFAGCP